MSAAAGRRHRHARSRARRLAVQALYQWQLAGHSAAELINQFAGEEGFERADAAYFERLVRGVLSDAAGLDAVIARFADRPLAQIDPVERAALLCGLFELAECVDVPYRVVIHEAIELTRLFGGTDAHRYVNALLDRAARELRAVEYRVGDPA